MAMVPSSSSDCGGHRQGHVMRLRRFGSVGEMITDTLESLQLTQGFKHEPSVPVINTQAHWERTHLDVKAIPYASRTLD